MDSIKQVMRSMISIDDAELREFLGMMSIRHFNRNESFARQNVDKTQ
jgi:hypothetical protein